VCTRLIHTSLLFNEFQQLWSIPKSRKKLFLLPNRESQSLKRRLILVSTRSIVSVCCLKCSDGIHAAAKLKTGLLAESERKIRDLEKTVLAGMFVCQVLRRWL
jgi:hypothetical protein